MHPSPGRGVTVRGDPWSEILKVRGAGEEAVVLRALASLKRSPQAAEPKKRDFVPVVETVRPIDEEPSYAAGAQSRDALAACVPQSLRSLQVLLRAVRLYQKNHPKALESLEAAYESLREAAGALNGLEVRIDRGALIAPKLDAMPLLDQHGELAALAEDLRRAGIQSLFFAQKFPIGELDTFAHLVHASLLRCEEKTGSRGTAGRWAARLAEHRVEGIEVNAQGGRNVDTVLASLMAALMAYGGSAPQGSADETPILAPEIDDLAATLRLLARLTTPLEAARGLSAEEAARAIHMALAQASKETVRLLFSAISQYGPREGERPQPYMQRLSETLVLEFLSAELSGGALSPVAVRPAIHRLGDELVSAGRYAGPHASQHLSALASEWSKDTYREHIIERLWTELAAREKSITMRGPEVWCVPVTALRQTLRQLADAGADAPRREARNILLNYARCLDSPDPSTRRCVATGLGEMSAPLESLWPNQLPEDLSRGALQALEKETVPENAALLSAFLEILSRICASRTDFAGLEAILLRLEGAPRDAAHEHMTALARRLVAQDRWLLLVDAALAHRPLDPVLPRLLQRDPERVLDRLTLLLTEPRGHEQLPAMGRLLRAIGIPALSLLETRLYEARRQRAVAAIKLLAVADTDRLLRALPRALPSWEWNLQDLAVSELARPANAASAGSAGFVFSTILGDAHPLVVPMMIDQIGVAQETTAIPCLLEIASGYHEILRDQFVRIKSIEALGRMRASEAAETLHRLAERREGLAYAEPAGLRAAAEEALALIENRPPSSRYRAAYEPIEQTGRPFPVPRRYTRVPLESPLSAQIEGPQSSAVRVRTISLGGAYLESNRKLSVGDSLKLEMRAGLRKIHFTAVVRNIGPSGGGIEFVHMKEEDREKLRRLVQRHLKI